MFSPKKYFLLELKSQFVETLFLQLLPNTQPRANANEFKFLCRNQTYQPLRNPCTWINQRWPVVIALKFVQILFYYYLFLLHFFSPWKSCLILSILLIFQRKGRNAKIFYCKWFPVQAYRLPRKVARSIYATFGE